MPWPPALPIPSLLLYLLHDLKSSGSRAPPWAGGISPTVTASVDLLRATNRLLGVRLNTELISSKSGLHKGHGPGTAQAMLGGRKVGAPRVTCQLSTSWLGAPPSQGHYMFGSPRGAHRAGLVFQLLLHESVSTHRQLPSLYLWGCYVVLSDFRFSGRTAHCGLQFETGSWVSALPAHQQLPPHTLFPSLSMF